MIYGAGSGPSSVAISNLNGDANPDLVVANRYSRNVSVLLSNRRRGSAFERGELKSQ